MNAAASMTPFMLAAVLGLVALALAAWLILRARKPALPPLQAAKGLMGRLRLPSLSRPANPWNGFVRDGLAALRYLSTRREWRYAVPWVLLLGEKGAGKTSLAESVTTGRRQELLLREYRLAMDGTAWKFFNRGVLIDPDGALPAAASESAEAESWQGILSALEEHRPERPIDSLALAVSASNLLAADPEVRERLAEQCYEQLFRLQQRFEFAYPVYVVVTGCDAVEGFAAFWKAQPAERRKEIWGWSNPSFQDGGTPEQCARAAWKSMGASLRQIQMEAAAGGGAGENSEDSDRFFLFPQRFGQLEAPLARFLGTVFQPNAYQADNYLRGIYCTGSVEADGGERNEPRRDVAFADALFDLKIFAETGLARPTRQSIWSRNRLLRRLQNGAIGLMALLFLALAGSVAHLGRQIATLSGALETLRQPEIHQEQCAGKDTVFQLLHQIEGVDNRLVYGAIPASWINSGVMATSTRVVSEEAFRNVIMPGLACRLEQKSRDLLATAPPVAYADRPTADAFAQARDGLVAYVAEVVRFEEQARAFETLATPSPPDEAAREVRLLWDLAEYAYGEAPPKRAFGDGSIFAAVLAQLSYPKRPRFPDGLEDGLALRIDARAAALQRELERQLGLGDEIIGQIAQGEASVLGSTRRFGWWFDWVHKDWLVSSDKVNPCRQVSDALAADLDTLRKRFGFPAAVSAAAGRFSAAACYEPAMRRLAAVHMPPYGNLFEKKGGFMQIAAPVAAEMRGVAALTSEDFMQVNASRPFACLADLVGWRPQAIEEANRYIRDYQSFARLQGADAALAESGRRPLYDRLARRQLEAVLNDILGAGQIPAPLPDSLRQAGVEPLSGDEQELSRRSGDFAGVVDPLLHTLRLYRQMGMGASANRISQCVRNHAADMLRRVDALAEMSRLYDPAAAGAGEESAGPVYVLGGGAVTKDYLARQLQRGQVLGGYATPFVAFLKNSEAVDESKQANNESTAYWDNTLSEMQRYVQFKEPNGQVAFLENYFLKQLADLTYDNCGKTLAAYRSEPTANDFFAIRRHQIEAQTMARCTDRGEADAYAEYRTLANRFNRELAGRYPFADLDARDAPSDIVKAFFVDYEKQRSSLKAALTELNRKRWQKVRDFVDQLDTGAAFFRAGPAAADGARPLHLDIAFRALPRKSPGSEQIVSWQLSSGAHIAFHPNGTNSLEWPAGEMLALELQWAEQSKFRPVGDPGQSDLLVEDRTATFVATGEWALLRFIAGHRPSAVPAGTGTDGGHRILAEFVIPVSAQKVGPAPGRLETARAYLAMSFAAVDAKTQATTPLPVPAALPHRAPLPW